MSEMIFLESLTYFHALMSRALLFHENSIKSNPSCGLVVEEDGLQHRAMVLAYALAEAEDVGKMVVKKVKARGNGMGWELSGCWELKQFERNCEDLRLKKKTST